MAMTIKQAKEANEQFMCCACGKRHRAGFSRICSQCHYKQSHLGYWDAKTVRLKEVKPYIEKVDRLIKMNAAHPAIAAFKSWWANTVELAKSHPESVPAAYWFSRFPVNGGEDALKIVGGLWLAYHDGFKQSRIGDERGLSFQTLKLLCQSFVPSPTSAPSFWRKMLARDRREAAALIFKFTVPICTSLSQAVAAEEAAFQEAKKLLEQPFVYQLPPGGPTNGDVRTTTDSAQKEPGLEYAK